MPWYGRLPFCQRAGTAVIKLEERHCSYTGNFSEGNVFAFKTVFSDDHEYMDFAGDLKDFIAEDKISEYQSRINTRNSDIFRQITADTKSMVSKRGISVPWWK